MRKINLTQNKQAIVDNDDYENLTKYKWYYHHSGYAVRNSYKNGIGETIFMHRQVLIGKKEMQADHVNGNKLDNRKENLRFATNSQNQSNKPKQKNSTTGYKGVMFDKQTNKFRARIYINKKCIDLGRYEDKIEAAIAYDIAAKKYHGKFAKLNFS